MNNFIGNMYNDKLDEQDEVVVQSLCGLNVGACGANGGSCGIFVGGCGANTKSCWVDGGVS